MNFKNHDSGEFIYRGLPPKKREKPSVIIRKPKLGQKHRNAWNTASLTKEQRERLSDYYKRNGWTFR